LNIEVLKITDVVLIYPYFAPKMDRSIFRVPPLGLGYIASYIRRNGFSVKIVDCTFLSWKKAVDSVRRLKPSIIGIYSMFSMAEPATRFAQVLRGDCALLVAGGPLPSVRPEIFLENFDLAVKGEGEQTFLDIVKCFTEGGDLSRIPGIFHSKSEEIAFTGNRKPFKNLDTLPFPARDLFPNRDYILYWRKRGHPPKTSIITTRGCPFSCDFCSNAVFGVSYRERTAKNVVEEVEDALKFGYDGIFFVDDCFTLNRKRVVEICDEILARDLDFEWECLSRVDNIDRELAGKMKRAGCRRIFFGIESGNERTLRIMAKHFSLEEARRTVENVASAGIKAGAFFIIGYPGETDESILDTINFSTSLPLEYLSFTLPYPIPGTGLYEKVKDRMTLTDWVRPKLGLIDHSLIYKSHFSSAKLKFAILKGTVQFQIKKRLGRFSWPVEKPFKKITNYVFKKLV
jgi:anaerobic magnesium-protoporphyrin IX monomethyl ester cyclase